MSSDLQSIFTTLRKELKQYEPPLVSKIDTDRAYDLWSEKEVEIAGRKKKEVYFAGVIIQKDFVGFYYMPVYTDTDLKKVFKPELLTLLKGKSCFHVKKLDDKILSQIKEALAIGFDQYKNNGWV